MGLAVRSSLNTYAQNAFGSWRAFLARSTRARAWSLAIDRGSFGSNPSALIFSFSASWPRSSSGFTSS
jgi:hypothetical protein